MAANKKKRIRVWTPEDRAAHRVFEKSRREAFNDNMIDLARQLPSLTGTRRLNKHMIVHHSLAYHRTQRQMCVAASREVQALLAERQELLEEVNRWRSASGAPFTPREARPIGQQLQNLLNVETETFGSFPNGFGENPPEGSSYEDQDRDELGYGTSDDLAPRVQGTFNQDLTQDSNITQNLSIPTSAADEFVHAVDLPFPTPLNVPDLDLYHMDGLLGLGPHPDFSEPVTNLNSISVPISSEDPTSGSHLPILSNTTIPFDFPNLHDRFEASGNSNMPVSNNAILDVIYEPLHQFDDLYPHDGMRSPQSSFPT